MNVPIMRTSERRDLLRCPWRWWLSWREGLRSRRYTPDALWFGTGVHIALAAWYAGPGTRRGPEPAETWKAWASTELRVLKVERPTLVDDELETEYVDATGLGTTILEEYLKLYGRDEQKLIIAPEKTFKLRVPWPSDQTLYPDLSGEELPNGGILFDYCGTFDGVWRDADDGRIWLDEHKTAAQISLDHLPLDPQAGAYWAVAGRTLRDEKLIGPKEKLAGIEYNFLRKALSDTRPRDASGYATNKPEKKDYIAALVREEPDLTEQLLTKWKLVDLQQKAEDWGLTVLGEISKVQPAKNFLRHRVPRTASERNKQLVRLQEEGLLSEAFKGGILPIVKNPTMDCARGAFRCPHYDVCELDERGGDIVDFKAATYDVQDPYADHRTAR